MVAGHIALTGASDQMMHGFGLAATGRHQDHVPGLHDGRESLGQAVGRHRFGIAAEEAGVVDPRLPLVNVLMRVREASEDPGSLNAMWPSVPIPRIIRSTPPASRITFSSDAPGGRGYQQQGHRDHGPRPAEQRRSGTRTPSSMTVRYRCG